MSAAAPIRVALIRPLGPAAAILLERLGASPAIEVVAESDWRRAAEQLTPGAGMLVADDNDADGHDVGALETIRAIRRDGFRVIAVSAGHHPAAIMRYLAAGADAAIRSTEPAHRVVDLIRGSLHRAALVGGAGDDRRAPGAPRVIHVGNEQYASMNVEPRRPVAPDTPDTAREGNAVELRDYIQILRRNWILIVAVALVGVLAAGAASLLMKPLYTSSTSVFFAIQSSSTTGNDINAGATYVQNQVKSFADVATTDKVLQPVINELELSGTVDDLAERVTATAPLDTVIIDISVEDEDPGAAADIANAIGNQLIVAVEDLTKPATAVSPVKTSIVAPALEATSATSPNIRLNLVLGLLVGLALGVGIAVLRQVLDTRIHSARDVEAVTDATIIGGITYDDEAQERPLVVQVSPQSPRAEAFRQLRTNLQFVEVADEGRTFVVTSSVPSEGKSSTSVNLAITLAEAGSRVMLIDGDLRRPKIAEYMGIEGAVGLTDYLIGQAELDDVAQPWGAGNLVILPAGQVPPNPSELLGSKSMVKLLARLDQEYDTVIIDAPPLLPVTDAAILSKLVSGGAMMVVGTDRITKHQLEAAIANLATVGGHLVGMILNFVPIKGGQAYGYYGYYGYAPEPPPKRKAGLHAR